MNKPMQSNGQDSFNFDRVTFNSERGEQGKEQGLALASLSRKELLVLAREVAVKVARQQGWVSYDDVFFALLDAGVNPALLGNAAGSVFNDERFVFTGAWEKSRRVSNHARANRIWTLKGNELILMAKKAAN